ncbi:RNA polymerase sigma factor SigX [Bacillus sp. 2205SS5-2]|uniref:RNA polymerase sigma factor SigX n=1 Tax=Bacillus sp. 2205SS5-2 TaxID=3109031 RepID=UPI0030047863
MRSDFHSLYDNYHQDVFQFLIYLTKNRETAEDLVQEVYIRVLKSHHLFEGKSSEKTWLFSISKNVAVDYFRKQKGWKNKIAEKFDWSKSKLESKQLLPEEVVEQNEEIQAMYQCLDLCTVDQKMVVVLRYLQELSIKETAEALEWTESKVKTTQHRALRTLNNAMKDRMQEMEGRNHDKTAFR